MRTNGSTAKVVFELAAAAMDDRRKPIEHLRHAWSRRRHLDWSVRVDDAGAMVPGDPSRHLASLSLISVGETPEGLRPRILRMSMDVPMPVDGNAADAARTLLDMAEPPIGREARPVPPPFGDVISTIATDWPIGRRLTSVAYGSDADDARAACGWQTNGGTWMMADCDGGATATSEQLHPATDGMRLDVEIVHEALDREGAARRFADDLAVHQPRITRCDGDHGLSIEASSEMRLWRFSCPGPAAPWTVHDVDVIATRP